MDAQTVYVLLTMDCESAKLDVTSYGAEMSSTGPADYEESERSIRGYFETARSYGFPVTLFVHPEVAVGQPDLLLELQVDGACLGLHLHPYKFAGGRYAHDLGAYPTSEQRAILEEAITVWEDALGQRPRYFRAGYFSANDNTAPVLEELGFRGGSLSCPERVLPAHGSVWAGSEPYPHRAHPGFRFIAGVSDFINVPVSVAYNRPAAADWSGAEAGYEWPYIPHPYDHPAIIEDILTRFETDRPRFGTIVTDTHNDHDYTDPAQAASINLSRMLTTIAEGCARRGMQPVGVTLDRLCDLVRAEG